MENVTIEERDDSGLMTMFELISLGKGLCGKLENAENMLQSPMMMGMGNQILKKTLPLPGPGKLGPTVYKLFSFLYDGIALIEDTVANYLEHIEKHNTPPPKEVPDKDDHKKLELNNLLNLAILVCKGTRMWYDIIYSPAGDLLGLGFIRLPVKDFGYSMNWLKVFDFLNLESIPGRVQRLLHGKLGQLPKASTDLSSFFSAKESGNALSGVVNKIHKKKSVLTTEKTKTGLFGGLFGGNKKEVLTTATEETKKSGFFGGLFNSNNKETAPEEAEINTEKPKSSGFLFGRK